MGDWPQLTEGQRAADAGTNTGTSGATTVGSSATVNLKGAWVQLLASTAFDGSYLGVWIGGVINISVLLDIGIGAAASEYAILPNLFSNAGATSLNGPSGEVVVVPLAIPSGSRISARTQASAGSTNIAVAAWVIG